TGNAATGLQAFDLPGGRLTVFNSILFGNSPDAALPSYVETRRNLVGIDPSFVDPTDDDYRLLPHSIAIDFGDDAPPGGLGPTDVDGHRRRNGAAVDAGAHESDYLCRVDRFGEVRGLGADTAACSCFRDDTARAMNCGFFLPDLFLEARIPLPFAAGDKLDTGWTVHPWMSGDSPYELRAELVAAKPGALPVEPPGRASGKLVPGKDVAVRVALAAPASPATLRLRLRYRPPGAKDAAEAVAEVLLVPSKP